MSVCRLCNFKLLFFWKSMWLCIWVSYLFRTLRIVFFFLLVFVVVVTSQLLKFYCRNVFKLLMHAWIIKILRLWRIATAVPWCAATHTHTNTRIHTRSYIWVKYTSISGYTITLVYYVYLAVCVSVSCERLSAWAECCIVLSAL